MSEYKNPFEYEAASKLPPETIRRIYIQDYNFTRFIESKRNAFLLGERGSGKSMALLYNSFKVRNHKELRNGTPAQYDYIGIYVPCKTPYFHKKEYELFLDEFHQVIYSEHCLCLSIAFELIDALSMDQTLLDGDLSRKLKEEFSYIFLAELLESSDFFSATKQYIQQEQIKTQRFVNRPLKEEFYEDSLTFPALILPLLNIIKKIPALKDSHFIFLIDDAHDLNPFQKKLINSWIAYREHTLLSFKVASASKEEYDYLTISGGTIVEHHDFLVIDMEEDIYNNFSPFGKLAKELLQKRLEIAEINVRVEDFFPEHEQVVKDLERSKEKARTEAIAKNPNATPKQIQDYIYKLSRSIYFRERKDRANLPPYAGLEILINLSTGVVRNLLDPCYWMYDACYSSSKEKPIDHIPASIQDDIIIKHSKAMWEKIKTIHKSIRDCTPKQSDMIYNLFNNLARLFKERQKKHKSEPGAIVFTISAMTPELREKIIPLLNIARSAQLLYQRSSTAKNYGDIETYYVPNRMLYPIRGLDPVGQHARVSIKAIEIWNAANGKPFVYVEEGEPTQKGLFNE